MDQTPRINRTRTALAVTALLACMPVSFAGPYGGAYGGYSDASSRAATRLAERAESAKQTIEKGRALYKEGEYEQALEAFNTALLELPNSPYLADQRAYATQLVATATVAVAQQYRKTGRYEEAEEYLKKVLELDPKNRAALQELEYLRDPIRTNPALTPRHVENVKSVNTSLYKAHGHFDLGQFDEAIAEFQKVLRIDPYNSAALRGMERVINQGKRPAREAAYDHARAEMLDQVTAAWAIPVPMEAPRASSDEGRSLTTMAPATAITMKLKNIILPEVNFENTTVEEAIDFLRQRSRLLDTTPGTGERGVNFIIRTGAAAGIPVGSTLGMEGEDLSFDLDGVGAGPAAAAGPSSSTVIPELKLRNVPMLEVLKFITDNAGMRYKVEDYAVVILPSGANDTDIFSRTFSVPPTFYSTLERSAGGSDDGGVTDIFSSDSGGATGIRPRKTVEQLLKDMGIEFPPGATATYVASSASLIVRNTSANLDMIEQFIESSVGDTPRQVKITTKFVEVSQDNTEELGFDWVASPFKISGGDRYLGGGTTGSGAGRYPSDFVGAAPGAENWVNGITGSNNETVNNIVTSGNRTGESAISGNAINSLINNPNRAQQTATAAPGIMSFTGIFSKGTMQVIMRGLSQKKGTDVLTAPSVTAKSGEKAKIEVIREFIYPTDYTEPQLPTSTGSSERYSVGSTTGGTTSSNQAQISAFPVTPSTPTGFNMRPIGVTLEIEPTIGDQDSSIIDFKFVPEIVEFDGFINYGSPISTAGIDSQGNPTTVVITENRIEMPVFSTRRVDTALTIYDGHTVSIGGLIQESVQAVEDKVPILGDLPLVGRLFRSEATNHVKTNLIIFVTGDIIDATGRPVRSSLNSLDGDVASPVSDLGEGLLPVN